jgi:hypothetical protein
MLLEANIPLFNFPPLYGPVLLKIVTNMINNERHFSLECHEFLRES